MNTTDPTGKFCYSLDEEWYRGNFDTPSSAAAQAETDIDDECADGEVREYHVAECCHPIAVAFGGQKSALWLGETIIEQIDEQCGNEISAEDAILDMSKEDLTKLGVMVLKFVRENAAVQYYGIKNQVKHTYVAGSSEFNWEIAMHVRNSLLSLIAADEGTTSPVKPGMILTDLAEAERSDFHRKHGDGNCSCFISPPCGSCTHPGNPRNQEECDECWVPVLKGGEV